MINIVNNEWGSITLMMGSETKTFKDAVIYPDECREWRWTKRTRCATILASGSKM